VSSLETLDISSRNTNLRIPCLERLSTILGTAVRCNGQDEDKYGVLVITLVTELL